MANPPEFDLDSLIAGTVESMPVPPGDFWVFAYGSLMWNPGFEFNQSSSGILTGYHRRLCLWSIRYRGNAQTPGLVLGLDQGGHCHGYCYQVSDNNRVSVLEYLCDRELITGAYTPMQCDVSLDDGRTVSALTFISKQDHPHFVPPLPVTETALIVDKASGERGCNRSYVLNTVSRLHQLNIQDSELDRVAHELNQQST